MSSEEFRPPLQKNCEACGAEILLVRNKATGNTLPLQRIRTVYTIDENERAEKMVRPASRPSFWVSHFEICTDPARFSRKK